MRATVSAGPRVVASGPLAARAHYAAPLAFRPMQRRVVAVQQRVMATAIVIQGRNVEVTPAIKDVVEEKIGKAIKMFDAEGVKEVGAEPLKPRLRSRRPIAESQTASVASSCLCRCPISGLWREIQGSLRRCRPLALSPSISLAACGLSPTIIASPPVPCPLLQSQVDVKLSVRGNPRGRATEAHHQRDQTVEVTVYTLR